MFFSLALVPGSLSFRAISMNMTFDPHLKEKPFFLAGSKVIHMLLHGRRESLETSLAFPCVVTRGPPDCR